MKPKIVCAECKSELEWGDRFCVNCGKPVDWPTPSSQQDMNTHASHQASMGRLNSSASVRGMRECNRCGTQNSADALFCEICGADLKANLPPPTQQGKPQANRNVSTKKGSQVLKNPSDSAPAVSWKTVVGFATFLVVGVFVLDRLTTKNPEREVRTQPQPEQAASANMQVLPQIEELEKKVLANPSDATSTLELANLLHDNRFYDKAITYYQKYLEKNSKDPNARVDLGICYFDLGKLDEAQQQMERALKDDPKHLLAHFNLGIVNLRAGKMKEANEWFKKTIALSPNSPAGKQAQQYLEQHSTF